MAKNTRARSRAEPVDDLPRGVAPTGERRVCFVTGTRAEFGLMQSTLKALREEPRIRLQLIATGMHLNQSRGSSIDSIAASGWTADRTVPWDQSDLGATATARQTGEAMAGLADAFEQLRTEIALVVGDRVEAFAAAAAAHVSGRIVAHVHGGDRALGLVDDSLRHAITKLAHVHFPATRQSARRIAKLGEESWRIHTVGSPGLDDIHDALQWDAVAGGFPGLTRGHYVLLALHPATADPRAEERAAATVLGAVMKTVSAPTVVIYPNNDPGSEGIAAFWRKYEKSGSHRAACLFRVNLPRNIYLGLLREASLLVGNSSSGIIEAASFGTPVINIGPRQEGRERGRNVLDAPLNAAAIGKAVRQLWRQRTPSGRRRQNLYGGGNAGIRIAAILGLLDLDRHRRKLIAY